MEKSPFIFRNPKILILELRLEELAKRIEPFVREKVQLPDQIKREIQYNLSEYDEAISDSVRKFATWVRPLTNSMNMIYTEKTNG